MAEGQQIKLMMVIEVLGSPKEHVEQAMKQIIGKLENDKSIKLLNQTTYKAEEQEIKEEDRELMQKTGGKLPENKLWSTFADIGLSTTLKNIPDLCFNYMPSSIEILEPAELKMKSVELTDFFSDVQAMLHKLDMMVKNLNAENTILKKQLDAIKSPYKMTYK